MLNQYSTDDSDKPEALTRSDPHSTDKDTVHKSIPPFTEPHTKHHPKYGAIHKDWQDPEHQKKIEEAERAAREEQDKAKQPSQ